MTIQEILDRVSEYHPDLGEDYHGCDEVKFGDCSQECTGIVSALVPTVDVIRRAVELKANLLYVHEPVQSVRIQICRRHPESSLHAPADIVRFLPGSVFRR